MLNDARVASASSYGIVIEHVKELERGRQVATVRDFHQDIYVNLTNHTHMVIKVS